MHNWAIAVHLPRFGVLTFLLLASLSRAGTVTVGSKNFTEGYLLAEIAAQWLEAGGFTVDRRFGFGGTKVAYEALVSGEISLYPEYAGTIAQVILDDPSLKTTAAINARLKDRGLRMIAPLGFNNTYAMAVSGELAARLGLKTIGDLAAHPDLRFAFSHEFTQRRDGWPGLRARYRLPQIPLGIEHGLAYQAIAEHRIDVTDAYSTDGDIVRFGLRLLVDDAGYFPDYHAAWLTRSDIDPAVVERLGQLQGAIDNGLMRSLNAKVLIDKASFAEVAAEFIAGVEKRGPAGKRAASARRPPGNRLLANVWRHLQLTLTALAGSVLAGVALALFSYRRRHLANALLYFAGLMQTIPSIALLALMLPLLGIGFLPAVTALFLYSLLPILRATLTALAAIDPLYRRVAAAIGMTGAQEFRHVLLPLALPHVLAGIRTASIISIGTATLAAFIGAGGLGQPIVTGLALNDTGLILQGAIPAAILAIMTDILFDLAERALVPPHMRVSRLPV